LDERGDFVAMAAKGKVQIFQLPAGTLLAERPYEGDLDGIFFSRTSRWIGIASGGQVRLWLWRFSEVKAGDTIPLKGVQTTVVISDAKGITKPLKGAGTANPACKEAEQQAAAGPKISVW
jgi:hypothetical protein